MAKLKIAINRHVVAKNHKEGTKLPPITVYRGGRPIARATWLSIPGPSEIVYCPEHPLKCGARVWLETDAAEVMS